MREPSLPAEGGCRCGRVRVRVDAPPLLTMACHCRGCQRMSASAFSLSAAIPTEGFSVIAGEPVIGGVRGADIHHYFCPDCMSWMFTRMAGMDMFVNLRPTMLDDAGWFSPYVETYTSTMLPWARTGAVRSFAEFPPFEEYGRLVADYAAAVGRAG